MLIFNFAISLVDHRLAIDIEGLADDGMNDAGHIVPMQPLDIIGVIRQSLSDFWVFLRPLQQFIQVEPRILRRTVNLSLLARDSFLLAHVEVTQVINRHVFILIQKAFHILLEEAVELK